METNQNLTENSQTVSQEQMLQEILENSRKTKNYMKWQLYITIALVVLPLIGMVIMVPILMSSLGSTYGAALQGI